MPHHHVLGCMPAVLIVLASTPRASFGQVPTGPGEAIASRTATVDGLRLHYLTAGHGPVIVLLHGFAETSRMWRPLMRRLAPRFTLIAPDLPGIGESDIPSGGASMTRAAARIHGLVKQLGAGQADVVGHDIGLMVAYAYAAQFPADVKKLVLMDAALPGVDGWEAIYDNPARWHFRFNGPIPEALVQGRERTYFDYFWGFAADQTHSVSLADRDAYVAAYSRPGRMRAAWAYFAAFPQTATEFAAFARTKLTMPVLAIGGDKANGPALAKQVTLVATNTSSVVLPNTGHWVMDENPRGTMDALEGFLGTASGRRGPPPR